MTFYGPMPWFKFRDRLRRTWRVELSTPTLTPALNVLAGGCYGFCDPEKRLIVVDVRYNNDRQNDTLMHEMCHAAASEREDVRVKVEEHAVHLISAPLLHILMKGPCALTFPPKPVLYNKFRRWARSVDPGEG